MPKLLLVEDDNNLREIYEARLQAEGYTIVTARDGEEALVVAKAEKPDLIIADIMMPKISGFEMLDILRNTDGLKEVKVIMLTALGQNDDQQRADKLGADRYLVKSQVTLEDIVKVAHELLGETDSGTPATATNPPAAQAESPAAAPAPAVATEPVTTPVAPESEPVVEAPAEEVPKAEAAVETDAEPAAKEEADVEARIEDFVAGATEDATPPANTPQAADTPAVPANDATTADDKIMADAVETLVASTDSEADKSIAPTTISEPKVAPAPPTLEPTAAAAAASTDTETVPAPTSETEDKPASDVRVAPDAGSTTSKKIIKPLEAEPKKDLDTLLAIEDARAAKSEPLPPTTPIIVDVKSKAAPVTEPALSSAAPEPTSVVKPSVAAVDADKPADPTNPPVDPNSIAL